MCRGPIKEFIQFVKTAGTLGGGSVGLAILLFAVAIYEHQRDKNVPVYWLLLVAAFFFAYGAYRAWANENEAVEQERQRNSSPSLKIELVASFFDLSKARGKNDLQVHVLAYLRVTNLNTTEALIKDGTLVMETNGVRYRGSGDDTTISGNAIEHVSDVRLGGERKADDVFGNTLTPLHRLLAKVTPANPLRRGITQEGFFVFTFPDQVDWDCSSPYVMPVRDAVFTLRDSFDAVHSVQVPVLGIPHGTVTTAAAFGTAISGRGYPA